jgi:DinB family protein
MTYTSVAQIIEEIDKTRERLYRRVEGLTDEQATERPNPNAWTLAEIVEHLALLEGRLLRMMTMMLTKAESAGARDTDAPPVLMKPFTLDEFIERARNEKYTAPEAVRPGGQVSLADSLANLRRSREELRALRPRIEAVDLSTVTYPHPAFGPLNFYQWLALIGMHEERHLRQAEAATSSVSS